MQLTASAFGIAANNGATISAAPSQPWYKNPCVTSALGSGAVNAGIDAIGLLPEGKAFTGAYSLFHGAAGASNGWLAHLYVFCKGGDDQCRAVTAFPYVCESISEVHQR
jgi:hypothetical protein